MIFQDYRLLNYDSGRGF